MTRCAVFDVSPGWQGSRPGRRNDSLSSLANPHAKANKIVAPSVRFAVPVFTAGVEDDAGSCQCCLWFRQPDVPKNSTRVDQDARIKEDTLVEVHKGHYFTFRNRMAVVYIKNKLSGSLFFFLCFSRYLHTSPSSLFSLYRIHGFCWICANQRESRGISFDALRGGENNNDKKNLNWPDQGVLGASTQEQKLLSCPRCQADRIISI